MIARLRGEPFPPDTTTHERFAASSADVDRASLWPMSLVEVWRLHREALLAEWLERWPGTRPAGWWRFDAPRWPPDPDVPERVRAMLSAPRGVRVDGEPFLPELPRGWVPAQYCGLFARAPWRSTQADPEVEVEVEAQHVYLARHGLLTPAEALAVADAPEIEVARVTASAYGIPGR